MYYLDQLERNYSTYIDWLNVLRSTMKFGNVYKNYIDQEFKLYCRLQKKEIVYYDPGDEMKYLKYNLACIQYAKGILNIKYINRGDNIPNENYHTKACKTLSSFMDTAKEL